MSSGLSTELEFPLVSVPSTQAVLNEDRLWTSGPDLIPEHGIVCGHGVIKNVVHFDILLQSFMTVTLIPETWGALGPVDQAAKRP